MTGPDISVVVPVYNTAQYLPRCVESLLTGGEAALEVLLVDNGSTDGSGALCDRYAAEDPRVRALHLGEKDVSAARNAGLSAARGEYVWFVDSDDEIPPHALDTLWRIARENRPDLIRFGYRRVENGREVLWLLPDAPGLYRGDALDSLRLDAISSPHVLDYAAPRPRSGCSMLSRREFLTQNAIRFEDEGEILNEDYLFVLQAMWASATVYVCEEPLYCYQVRGGSLSTAPRPRMHQRKQALYRRYRDCVPAQRREVAARLENFYIDGIYDCFTKVCKTAPDAKTAADAIRPLLADPELQRCLAAGKKRIRSPKARCICFLMKHRMGGLMYRLYRLAAKY